MHEIKKIKILSSANIVGLICGTVVFLSVFVFYLVSMINAAANSHFKISFLAVVVNLGLGFLISLLAAVATGASGWLFSAFAAWLYNFFAREIGGVKMEFGEGETVKSEELPKADKQKLFKY